MKKTSSPKVNTSGSKGSKNRPVKKKSKKRCGTDRPQDHMSLYEYCSIYT